MMRAPIVGERGQGMAEHSARVVWDRGTQDFLDRRYSRSFRVRLDGGIEVPGSASPHIVPPPMSDPAAMDPEEAFVAALAGCHMLWFLDLACRDGWCVDRYDDAAVGRLAKDADGRLAMTRVTLRPEVAFGGAPRPGAEAVLQLHHRAHEACFIASSVKTEVVVEPR